MDLIACSESPPCGSPVIDTPKQRRLHTRWHERVFIEAPLESDPDHETPQPRPRYVGVDD